MPRLLYNGYINEKKREDMLQKKSVLARLLANENVTVRQGNYSTASFDVVNRVLNLPLWKDMSNDLYDLLVGHEVSHALHTPADPKQLNIPNVPFSFVNVVEDIRIEKMILRKYPGLVGNFTRGYKELLDMDLFGIAGKDLNTLPFMDKLNIKSKGRNAIEVEFTDEETPYFEKAMAVETFEDVREVVLEIAAWLRSKNEDVEEVATAQDHPQPGDEDENAESMPGMPSEENTDNDSDQNGQGAPSDEQGEDESESSTNSDEESDDEGDDENKEASNGAGTDIHSIIKEASDDVDDLDEVATDMAQHENESMLVDSQNKIFAKGMTRQEFKDYTTSYSDVLESRINQIMDTQNRFGNSIHDRMIESWKEFEKSSKPVVNLMAKEFEMRKAAYRTKRARTSTKGSIDVNKLHAYKYDDNLFKQVTTLADGKNHGLMMLVDYSGSMSTVMPKVIKQTINLVMFCKRVNIPFQVFGFTSSREERYLKDRSVTQFDSANLALIELYSSKMTKKDLEFAMYSHYIQAIEPWYYQPRLEQLGSTPLNAALMAMKYAIEDFRKNYPVDKMRLITLTDGDSDSVRYRDGKDVEDKPYGWETPVVTDVNGKMVELKTSYHYSRKNTAKILKAVCGNDVTAVNFFLADNRGLKQEMWTCFHTDYNAKDEALKKLRKDGVLVLDNVDGYDCKFIIRDNTKAMSAENEDLEVAEGATPAQIAKAFKKFSGSKKGNRLITKKFTEIIA